MTHTEYLEQKVKALEELVMSLIKKIDDFDKSVSLTYEILQKEIDEKCN